MLTKLSVLMTTLAMFLATPVFGQKRIALSFDDVPRHAGGFLTPDERAAELLAALNRAGVKQAGFFVTTGNLEKSHGAGGEARIAAYVAAGHVIANHSATHPWLSRSSVEDYLKDVDQAESWLKGRQGRRAWFRFPYLDEGKRDLEKRDAVREGLQKRGLFNAYVTIDNYDWHLDSLASRAKRSGQAIEMDALRDLYVETLLQVSNFYDEIAIQTLGRSPAHVILLHETDLAALFVDDLVAALKEDGWEIISIDEAYEDPIAKAEPDTFFLGSGRVAALAHVNGSERIDLVHERTDEEVLDALFAERVIRPSADVVEPSLVGRLLLPGGVGSRGVELRVTITQSGADPRVVWVLFDEQGRFTHPFIGSLSLVSINAGIAAEVHRVDAGGLPQMSEAGEIDLGLIDLRDRLTTHRMRVRAAEGQPGGEVRVAMWSGLPHRGPNGEPVSLGSRQFPPVVLGGEVEWLVQNDAESIYFLVERPLKVDGKNEWRGGQQRLFGPFTSADIPAELVVDSFPGTR